MEGSQTNDLSDLYQVLDNYIDPAVKKRGNTRKSWKYGYDKTHDMVIISKTGEIGEIYKIQNLVIALPEHSKDIIQRSKIKDKQYWEPHEYPEDLKKIKTEDQWKRKPKQFKLKWIDYIDREFHRRDYGVTFMNNGVKTWLSPSHYMYLQWSETDIGHPDFREANRIFYIFWEACWADARSYGMNYLKIRRSGFSFMASSQIIDKGTSHKKKHLGMLSKTGPDAKELFTAKVVPISNGYPFFFKPTQSGMDTPKTQIEYTVPAKKITRNNMNDSDEDEEKGIDTFISWKNTADNSYDGLKLLMLIHDEAYKWEKPVNIKNNWKVTKTCLRLGRKIIGKCMMGSTCNALKKGGQEGKDLYYDSDVTKRNANGQTKSGLYSLFIPMEYNMEGFIDIYGMPVLRTPEEPVLGIDGEYIEIGAIDYWEAEAEGLKNSPDDLNEFYRQYPRTEQHAFRDDSKESIFDLTKIYEQVDYNDSFIKDHLYTRGNFHWIGERFGAVKFTPDPRGRFLVAWTPPPGLQNLWKEERGVKYPLNDYVGCIGVDSYDISGVVSGGGSKGAAHGLTGFHMDNAPVNQFVFEYVARPPMAEIFFEDILMAMIFYGFPVLAENNKPRFLYFLKNNGFRGYSLTRPDKPWNKLSKTEIELGGIPSSEQVISDQNNAIEMWIERYVGIAQDSKYRDKGDIGVMPFNRTLLDWAAYNPRNRTVHDPSVSSSLAIMGVNRHSYKPAMRRNKIKLNFATYDNNGHNSVLNANKER